MLFILFFEFCEDFVCDFHRVEAVPYFFFFGNSVEDFVDEGFYL